MTLGEENERRVRECFEAATSSPAAGTQPADLSQDIAQVLELLEKIAFDGKHLSNLFQVHESTVCTKVWGAGALAYRCKTCQVNDSSALCVDCFNEGRPRSKPRPRPRSLCERLPVVKLSLTRERALSFRFAQATTRAMTTSCT